MKKKKGNNNYYKRVILVSTMMLCIIVSMSTYWMFAYKNKYGNLFINNRIVSYKTSDYVSIEGNIVYLKNVHSRIINDFKNMQTSILSNNKVIDVKIDSNIYNNILSVIINYIIEDDINYEEVLTINIDLKNNVIISDEELLNMFNIDYTDVANDIYDGYIRLPDDYIGNVIDAINEEEMSSITFNDNSYKYLIRIKEILPSTMKLYIKDTSLYYVVRTSDINKVCYHTTVNMNYINREIGKL